MSTYWKSMSAQKMVFLIASGLSCLLILLVVVGAIWATRLPPVPVILPPSDALVAASLVAYSDEQTDVLSEINDLNSVSILVDRPLFWEGRRPVSEPEDGAENVQPVRASELDRVKLTGVYFAGDASGVIVSVGGQRFRVKQGEEVLSWKLDSLNSTEAVFSRGGQKKSIQLEHAKLSDYTAPASRSIPVAPESLNPQQSQ